MEPTKHRRKSRFGTIIQKNKNQESVLSNGWITHHCWIQSYFQIYPHGQRRAASYILSHQGKSFENLKEGWKKNKENLQMGMEPVEF